MHPVVVLVTFILVHFVVIHVLSSIWIVTMQDLQSKNSALFYVMNYYWFIDCLTKMNKFDKTWIRYHFCLHINCYLICKGCQVVWVTVSYGSIDTTKNACCRTIKFVDKNLQLWEQNFSWNFKNLQLSQNRSVTCMDLEKEKSGLFQLWIKNRTTISGIVGWVFF